jgi:magnesium-transporting ATPase (P-type)
MSSLPTNVSEHPAPTSTATSGLSSREAVERLGQYGPNEPTPPKRGAAVSDLLLLFLNPLVIILLVASIASFFLGDSADALIILVIVLLSVAINFFQTYRSQQAIKPYRDRP